MAAPIPDNEPLQIEAGDTLTWHKLLPDYPTGNGWTLTYNLRHPTASAINITATEDAGQYLVNVAKATTATWTAGTYAAAGYVTSATERFQVFQGWIIILANFAAQTTADNRSHAKICLDAINAVIEGRATRDELSYSINGRSVSKIPFHELLKLRDYYSAIYTQELNALRSAQGMAQNNLVFAKFTAS